MPQIADTSEIPVPSVLIDQVLGQEEACAIIRQAALQRRHVLLIGEPGTGKSLLGQAMAALTQVASPEDILVFPHPQEPNRPEIRRVPAGQGAACVAAHRARTRRATQSLRFVGWLVTLSLLLVSGYFAIREGSVTYLGGGLLGLALVLWIGRQSLPSPTAAHRSGAVC
jgi:Lon-like ATP-dependent protease